LNCRQPPKHGLRNAVRDCPARNKETSCVASRSDALYLGLASCSTNKRERQSQVAAEFTRCIRPWITLTAALEDAAIK
jgi:hypothetical protein